MPNPYILPANVIGGMAMIFIAVGSLLFLLIDIERYWATDTSTFLKTHAVLTLALGLFMFGWGCSLFVPAVVTLIKR